MNRRGFLRLAAGGAALAAGVPALPTTNRFGCTGSNLLTPDQWTERVFFRLLMGQIDHNLLPAVPVDQNGTLIFHTGIDWETKK